MVLNHVQNRGITKSKVKQLLLAAFNEAPTDFDIDHLTLLDTHGINRPQKLEITLDMLLGIDPCDAKIWTYEDVKDMTLTQEELTKEQESACSFTCSVNFNLKKFQFFLQQVEMEQHQTIRPMPLYDTDLTSSNTLLQQMHFKNPSSSFFQNTKKQSEQPKINALKRACC